MSSTPSASTKSCLQAVLTLDHPPETPHGRQSEYSSLLTDMAHIVTPSHTGTNL